MLKDITPVNLSELINLVEVPSSPSLLASAQTPAIPLEGKQLTFENISSDEEDMVVPKKKVCLSIKEKHREEKMSKGKQKFRRVYSQLKTNIIRYQEAQKYVALDKLDVHRWNRSLACFYWTVMADRIMATTLDKFDLWWNKECVEF